MNAGKTVRALENACHSALEVCSRQGAIQIHVYLYFTLLVDVRRTMPAAVKILGISSGVNYFYGESSSRPALKFCQLWFDGDSSPRTTAADYVIVPETHDRKSVLSSGPVFNTPNNWLTALVTTL